MAKFITDLILTDVSDSIWQVYKPFVYDSDIVGLVIIEEGFYTDLASVPKLPLIYAAWGNRAHYESVIHDFLYCKNAIPNATFDQANVVFLEAMKVRGKPWYISRFMYWGVCLGGAPSYHRRNVEDKL